jgi:hypothetical protein
MLIAMNIAVPQVRRSRFARGLDAVLYSLSTLGLHRFGPFAEGRRQVRLRKRAERALSCGACGLGEWEGIELQRAPRERCEISMRNCLHSCRVSALGGLALLPLFFAATARADQIALLVDESGREVYINSDKSSDRLNWVIRSFQSKLPAAPIQRAPEIDQLVEQTANRFQVDPELVRAIVQVESGYDPKAVSSKGAQGLMQLVPATAERFGVENPFDPKQNLEGGVNYLKYLLNRFGGDLNLSLAAYNAGEQTVHRFGGVPAIAETQDYLRKVTRIYQPANARKPADTTLKEPPQSAITRYVDEYGVVHYTNVD